MQKLIKMSQLQSQIAQNRTWNPIQVSNDKETGFIQSNRIDSFDAQMKLKFITLYKRLLGNTSEVCKILGIARMTAVLHQQNDPAFRQALLDAREEMIDSVEKTRFKYAMKERGVQDRDRVLERLRPDVWSAKRENSSVNINIIVDSKTLDHYQQRQQVLDAEIVTPDDNKGL